MEQQQQEEEEARLQISGHLTRIKKIPDRSMVFTLQLQA